MKVPQLFMTAEEYSRRRQGYKYPPAALVRTLEESDIDLEVPCFLLRLRISGPTNMEWNQNQYWCTRSSKVLDEFHHALLNSEKNDEVLHGILSVYYWGFYADRNANISRNRALGRAKQLIFGKKSYTKKDGTKVKARPPQEPECILGNFRAAILELKRWNIANALRHAIKLDFFGLSFASKLLTFASPDQAGVYDAVIAKYLLNQCALSDMGTSTKVALSESVLDEQVRKYQAWCRFCQDQAAILNEKNVFWVDWNGEECRWRAVDVERAHFAYAAELDPSKKRVRKQLSSNSA